MTGINSLAPALLRDGDCCAEVGLHLAENIVFHNVNRQRLPNESCIIFRWYEKNKPDAHVHTAVVLTNVKVEILVLYPVIWSLHTHLSSVASKDVQCSCRECPPPSSYRFIILADHNLQCLPSGNSPWKPPSSLPNSSVRSAYRQQVNENLV